jgi:type IV pilus assembly protein PilW
MIAIVIGLFLVTVLLAIFIVQTQRYRTTASQGFTQNAENAISALMLPYIRGAGFAGCATMVNVLSNLNTSTSPPLSTLNTVPSMIMGYDTSTSISQFNATNDGNASHWTPSLDSSLLGQVSVGSDVLVVLGPVPNAQPTGVTAITSSSTSFTVNSSSGITAGQLGAISDCAKAVVFNVTSVSGTTINHAAGSTVNTNATAAFAVNFPVGTQFIPVQQTAFFVGQGLGGQSSLMMATLSGSTWTVSPLVPGVDTMAVLYGIGGNSVPTQYVTAGNVTNWGAVYSIRLGFIIEGQVASGSATSLNPTQFKLFGNTITLPADSRLRHVYELSINVRNAVL